MQFNHVPDEWIKGALKSFRSEAEWEHEEMGAPGYIPGLVAEHQFLCRTTELRVPSHALLVTAMLTGRALPQLGSAPARGSILC